MYNDLNTDVNNYSINELFTLAELSPDSTNENINTHFTKIIQGYLKKKDYKMAQFFHDAKEKLLKSKNSNNDTKKNESEANEWLENLYRKPINEEQDEKITDRRQTVSIFENDSDRPIMTRDRLGIQNNVPLQESQDSLNPTLRQTITRNIVIDSSDRDNNVIFDDNTKNDNTITNFTLNLDTPLTNVLNMKIDSINIPKTVFTFDPQHTTNVLVLTFAESFSDILDNSGGLIVRITMSPGSYNTPIEFIQQLNLDLSQNLIEMNFTSNHRSPIAAHLVNPLSNNPKIFFINGSAYFVKITFYQVPGTGDFDLLGQWPSEATLLLNNIRWGRGFLDNRINPCNNLPTYKTNLGYYMGYRIGKRVDGSLYNTDISQNELSIHLQRAATDVLTGPWTILDRMTEIYDKLGFWDISYNSTLYARDIYELVTLVSLWNGTGFLPPFPLTPPSGGKITNPDVFSCIRVANVPLRLIPTRFIHICVDDFQKNRVPNNIIRGSLQENRLDIPSYVNLQNFSNFSKYEEQITDLTAEVICDRSSNLQGVRNKVIVPSIPRKITQNQIYAANQIINDRKSIRKVDNIAILDVLGTIPYNFSDNDLIKTDLIFKPRVYFGPVSFDRLAIQLRDDRGHIIDLNGNDWSMTLQIEQLYQY